MSVNYSRASLLTVRVPIVSVSVSVNYSRASRLTVRVPVVSVPVSVNYSRASLLTVRVPVALCLSTHGLGSCRQCVCVLTVWVPVVSVSVYSRSGFLSSLFEKHR